MKPAFVALALLLFAGFAKADTTYDYTGAQFSYAQGGVVCTPTCNVTGQLVVAQPLAPNTDTTFNLFVNPPVAFSFTVPDLSQNTPNGLFTVNGATTFLAGFGAFITVGTDAVGTINQYTVQIYATPIGPQFTTWNLSSSGTYADFYTNSYLLNGAEGIGYSTSAGVWTEEAAIGTPEPSSMLLLASGLGLLALLTKKSLTIA